MEQPPARNLSAVVRRLLIGTKMLLIKGHRFGSSKTNQLSYFSTIKELSSLGPIDLIG